MTPPKLTRKESQARTRARLLDSAAEAFARTGLERTSIEEIASGAGYTRGAFYAHFGNKEELALALLEDRFGSYLRSFDRTLATDDEPEVRARRVGDQFSSLIAADPEWERLSFEFAAYAVRNDGFRRELVERYRFLRAGVAEVFRTRAEEYGVRSPIPYERLALMTFTMSIGVTNVKLLEPDLVTQDLYGEMLAIFFGGLRTL